MLIPITVHVPEHLVSKFYSDFGRFTIEEVSNAPKRLESGAFAPIWVGTPEASDLAAALWDKVSDPGRAVLLYLSRETGDEPRYFRPDEVAAATQNPKGASGLAGVLGGIGKAIRRAGLPMYTTPSGTPWHYVWDWDGEFYIMTPEVASLIKKIHQQKNSGE